ncbi:protein phosphatase 2C domain-containing protein [Patescibacteria group bacterium]|jgi:serine/threonine protein phosphatase PrpC|nr:protein phosphatase 2C domain-containing protein [Patescibacteria group bacterium]
MPEKPGSQRPEGSISELPTLKPPPPNPFERKGEGFALSKVSVGKYEFISPEPGRSTANQDALWENADRDGTAVTVFVGDGIGGYAGGEIASSTVRSTIARENKKFEAIQQKRNRGEGVGPGLQAEMKAMRAVLATANEDLELARHMHAEDSPALKGMGTMGTLVRMVKMKDGRSEAVIGHYGDTRAMVLYPDGHLETVTLDAHPEFLRIKNTHGEEAALHVQSVLDRLDTHREFQHLLECSFEEGKWPENAPVTKEDIAFVEQVLGNVHVHAYFEYRNFSHKAFAREDKRRTRRFEEPDIRHVLIPAGGKLILTSDGIHDNLTTQEMEAILADGDGVFVDPMLMMYAAQGKTPAERLSEAAKARALFHAYSPRSKGPDDLTAVVVEIPER